VAVTNFGGVSGDITVNLTTQENPDEILDNQTVTDLASGETREIALTTELDATGETTLVVNGQTADTVTVADALAVTQRDVPTAVNSTTDTFTANVTVTDRVSDGETGSLDVSLTIGEETITENIQPNDGESVTQKFTFDTPALDRYGANISVGGTDPAPLDDVIVSQNTVDLDLTVEPSEIKLGEELTFTVTQGDNNQADGASVAIAGKTLATGDDGVATTTIATAGNYTAEATKEADPATNTSFESDSVQVNVTDSLNISIDAEFGEVDAAPTQGDSRPSDSQTVTIENTGGRSIALSGFGFTGVDADQYTITSNTPSSVPADSSRTIDVTFEPTVRSNTDANLRFRTDTSNSIRTFTLNGTGVGPDVELNTTALEFGSDLSESDLSVNRTINVTNEGNEPLSLTPDTGSVGDGFTAPSATTIPAQESRDLTVEFDPSDLGEFDDVLDIATNDTFAGTVGVSLSGTVSQTELSVSTTSVNVGEVPVDTTTSTDIVVSNTGTEQLTKINTTNETVSNGLNITSPSDDEPVVENLSAGSQQLITIEVTPTTDADQSKANLTVVPSGEATNKTVIINATPTAPALSVTPSVDQDPARDYGETPIGSSKTRQFTLDNTGDAPLQVSNLRINSSNPPSPFRLPDSTQDLEIPAGEEEAVTVAFTPQTPGEKTDSELEFEWNNASADGTTTVSAALKGDGTRTNISATSSTISFDTTGIGSTDEQQLEITNDGSESVSITNTLVNSLRGKFSVNEGTIPANIPAGESRNITIVYTPDEAGTDTTNLQVDATSGPTDSSLTVTLEGEGAPPIAQLTDQSLSFGYVNSISSDTASATTRIENAGINTTTLNITAASISGTDVDAFSIDESPADSRISGSPVNVGNPSAAATVSFDPATDDNGELTARLTIETNDPDNAEIDVPLRGVATTPEATVNRTTIGFGDVPVNANSATEGIQIRNQGGAPL
jgi:hypothetical protein